MGQLYPLGHCLSSLTGAETEVPLNLALRGWIGLFVVTLQFGCSMARSAVFEHPVGAD